MKKIFGIGGVLLFILAILSNGVSADARIDILLNTTGEVNSTQTIGTNGSVNSGQLIDTEGDVTSGQLINTFGNVTSYQGIYTNGSVNSYHNINASGDVEVWIDGTGLGYTLQMVQNNMGSWGSDAAINAIILNLGNSVEYYVNSLNGGNVRAAGLTSSESALLYYITKISDIEIDRFYQAVLVPTLDDHQEQIERNSMQIGRNIEQIGRNIDAISENRKDIQMMQYELEALKITLEKTNPEVYCEALREVMSKHGFDRVKCGLHSKKCYNGEIYPNEGGRNFCIEIDKNKGFPGCWIDEGECGHIRDIMVLESEEGSFTPLMIDFSNSGNLVLAPKIKVEIEKEYVIVSEFELALEKVLPKSKKIFTIYWNNSGYGAGDYKAVITITSGVKETFDEVNFTLLPVNSLERKGELTHLTFTAPELNENLEVEGRIENTGGLPLNFRLIADVYLNGTRIDSVEGSSVFMKPEETLPVSLSYNTTKPGDYELQVGFKDDGEKQLIKFTVERPQGPIEVLGSMISFEGGRGNSLFLLVMLAGFAIIVVLVIGIVSNVSSIKNIEYAGGVSGDFVDDSLEIRSESQEDTLKKGKDSKENSAKKKEAEAVSMTISADNGMKMGYGNNPLVHFPQGGANELSVTPSFDNTWNDNTLSISTSLFLIC